MRVPSFPLGEWFKILPSAVSRYSVSPVHILQHLSFLCTGGIGGMRHPLLCIVISYDIIYEGLSQVGNLRTSAPVEKGSSFTTLDQ